MKREHEGSAFVRHIPCDNPECRSSDANSLYSDGHTFCYRCSTHKNGDGQQRSTRRRVAGELIQNGEVQALPKRKITEETCQHFKYAVGKHGSKTVQIAPYFNAEGQLVAQKIRFADKTFKVLGDLSAALPFGATAFRRTGKKIVVTEGEIDALTMSQVQGNKWPVVSIACGAGGQVRKYMAQHREFFHGFDEVVLMFDMDEPGRIAAKIAAEVIGSRAKIAELPQGFKDPNEMLLAGKTEELVSAMWSAKEYRPEGIVDMASLKAEVKAKPKAGLSWPFPTLTKLTYGIRPAELYALAAGTGIGKTDFFTQLMKHLVKEHNQKIGVFSLEQKTTDTALRLVGKFAERPLHIPDYWDDTIFDESWDSLVKERQIFLYDSFGRNEWRSVLDKMEYLHHAEGVNHFFLDHLTAFVAGEEDERQLLDQIMEQLSATRGEAELHAVLHLAPRHSDG
jgi:twinkle protein